MFRLVLFSGHCSWGFGRWWLQFSQTLSCIYHWWFSSKCKQPCHNVRLHVHKTDLQQAEYINGIRVSVLLCQKKTVPIVTTVFYSKSF